MATLRSARSLFLCSAGVCLALLAAPSAVLAADDAVAAAEIGEAEVEGVVLTAAGFEQKITQAPASITVVPRAQLEEMCPGPSAWRSCGSPGTGK